MAPARAFHHTEQAKLQAALRESQARLRSIFECAVFGIYEGTLEGRLLAVNPALVAMLGYESAKDLLKIRIPDLYVDAELRRGRHRGAPDLGDFAGHEAMWRHRTGPPIRVRLTGHLTDRLTPVGEPIVEIFIEDITERHRLTEQVQHASKMEGIGALRAASRTTSTTF